MSRNVDRQDLNQILWITSEKGKKKPSEVVTLAKAHTLEVLERSSLKDALPLGARTFCAVYVFDQKENQSLQLKALLEQKPKEGFTWILCFKAKDEISVKDKQNLETKGLLCAFSPSEVAEMIWTALSSFSILPIGKIFQNIKNKGISNNDVCVVLMLSGSFNPVHRMHIKAFELAKKKLEEKYPVIGGYIAPSSDPYVRSKLRTEAMPLVYRNKLCALAVADSDWIDVCRWGHASSSSIARSITFILKKRFSRIRIIVYELCGADFVIRCHAYRVPMACVGRVPHTEEVKRVAESLNLDPFKFVVIDGDLDDISSTKIRLEIVKKEYEKMRREGWMHERVIHYLEEMGDKIFCF